ncbi:MULTISPECIES: sugar ABC transporter permease [unclassified Luteibacter]|uniref:sugar ABC transporter permease n=1 Tax=unclassified Luteibacter TaxID=2620188 RepID=UPI0008D47B76|nr:MULTISPECIES: sugar ABC transporter permease [unclassified Luteibacter]MDR6937043.1 D-xylose transport system permease protein [Luteibacter sp. 3190]SEO47041.1 D-xylose transport system permease protein [Luteibacter sp. UNC138MFCol5.1]SEW14668.1 xylose ABC transporter membrane protein [Luteibacter sp. 329MFSha]
MQAQKVQQLFVRYKILALLIAVALIWLFFHIKTDQAFVTPGNLSNLFRQMAITGMLACGMVFIIIAGEIDLSIGSQLGLLGGVVAILTVNMGWGTWPSIAAVLALGLVIGALNGFVVTKMRVPSFIVGLGGMLAFRGLVLYLTGSSTIAPAPDDLIALGQGFVPPVLSVWIGAFIFLAMVALTVRRRMRRASLGLQQAATWIDVARLVAIGAFIFGFVRVLNDANGIPIPVMILLALLAVFTYVSTQTVFGRHIYAVGGNMEATRLSGVNVARVKLVVFAIMGLMCAFAGIITVARTGSGSPSAGTGAELDAISACFIGGTSMRGGSGTVYGALIGALVMASLDSGMQLMDVDNSWQLIIKGVILVLAVWVDVLSGSNRNA